MKPVERRHVSGSSVQSPDATFRIEVQREYERFGVLETTRLVTLPDEVLLLDATSWGAATEALRFPAPGQVIVPLADGMAQWHAVHIDVPSRTFRIDAAASAEPLSQLPQRLAALGDAARRAIPPAVVAPPSTRQRIGNWAMALGGLLFAIFGGWLAVMADTPRDRWMGLACAVFFGGCAWVPLLELRRDKPRAGPSE